MQFLNRIKELHGFPWSKGGRFCSYSLRNRLRNGEKRGCAKNDTTPVISHNLQALLGQDQVDEHVHILDVGAAVAVQVGIADE